MSVPSDPEKDKLISRPVITWVAMIAPYIVLV